MVSNDGGSDKPGMLTTWDDIMKQYQKGNGKGASPSPYLAAMPLYPALNVSLRDLNCLLS